MSYLNQGGNLYIESVDLGKNHENTDFLVALGLAYSGDGGDNEVIHINASDQGFMDGSFFDYTGGTNPHFSIDRLAPTNGASVLYYSEDEIGRIFTMENETYRTISSSIIFGAVKNNDSLNIKPYLISEFFNYLLGIQTITALQEHVSDILLKAYPNPSTDQVRISYVLPEPQRVNIRIFDLNGKMIKQLTDAEQQPGNHFVTWDGTTDQGKTVEKGMYFYMLTTSTQTETGKITFMR